MGQMRESLKSRFLQICPLGMEKGERAAIPTQAIPMQGQVFSLLVTKGSRNCSRGCPQARVAELCHCLQEFQPGGSQRVMIQALLVSLPYTTSWML